MRNQPVRSLSMTCICVLVAMLLAVVLSSCTPERIEISPKIDVNPPGTQHEITAKVTDAKGRPVAHSLVEWSLPRSENAVGDIVEGGDDPKTTRPIPKKTNTYAKTRTNLDGEAKITITSPFKGKTSIVAVAKGIEDQAQHKAFAVKYWSYIHWELPHDARNLTGTPHRMTVRVYKPYSEQHPIRFKLTKASLDALKSGGLPEGIWRQLTALYREAVEMGQQKAKTKASFIADLSDRIGASQVDPYKPLILKHTEYIARDDDLRNYRVEWEILSEFQITEQAIAKLRAKGLSNDMLHPLERAMPHRAILGKREFLEFVAEVIGKEQLYQHQSLILRYTKIPSGPAAYFENNGTDLVTSETDSKGFATVTLRQILPKEGQNHIRVRLKLPNKLPDGLDRLCCPKPNDVMAEGLVKKTWVPPTIPIVKDCAASVALGDTTRFDITFTNASDFDLTSLLVTDKIPPGFTFMRATPEPPTRTQAPEVGEIDGTASWAFQELAAGASETIQIFVKAAYVGTFTNTVRLTTPHITTDVGDLRKNKIPM